MEVEVMSIDMVKPSSPTPPHLKTFKISLIDSIFPLHYVPILLFYPPFKDNHLPIHQLKHSLSQTLTRFYPLAGRVKNDDTIDCNDEGALFYTARVNCRMAELLKPPQIDAFSPLAPPLPPICPESTRPAQLAFQLNKFSCGGVALCVAFFHMIIDATTMTSFLKCWSAITTNRDDIIYPDYPAALLFPVGEEPLPSDSSSIAMERSLLREGKGVIKRFVFDAGAISSIKEKAAAAMPNPTRWEALSCFIWNRWMAAAQLAWGLQQPSMLSAMLDLRRRMVPPLSPYSVGNIVWKAVVLCDVEEREMGGMVGLLRKAMEGTRDEFVPKILKNGGHVAIREGLAGFREIVDSDRNLNPYSATSWCGMGFYDVDLGWGKPAWVSLMGNFNNESQYKNIFLLIEGETKDKIDVWMTLDPLELPVLERDPEFLAFASQNPPISI